MIHFLTNENIPERLQAAIEKQMNDQKKGGTPKHDRKLIFLGTFFLSALMCLAVIFVYCVITLF